jgi:hypothetical protein
MIFILHVYSSALFDPIEIETSAVEQQLTLEDVKGNP